MSFDVVLFVSRNLALQFGINNKSNTTFVTLLGEHRTSHGNKDWMILPRKTSKTVGQSTDIL